MARTAWRRSEQAFEVDAVMSIDESTARFRGRAWARKHLPLMPEGAGVDINYVLSHYNSFLGGVDGHDTLLVPQQRVLPEDVLR